jgi:hypothetical protein
MRGLEFKAQRAQSGTWGILWIGDKESDYVR